MKIEKRSSALEKARRRLVRLEVEKADRRQIQRIAKEINAHSSDAGENRPVVFFNASTRLNGLSLNAAYSLITAWATRLSGARVIHLVCDHGMSHCVLGTNRDNPQEPPPCRQCTAFSMKLFEGAEQMALTLEIDHELEGRLELLDLAGLEEFAYGELPLGELVLPSMRWILRRHHLEDDPPTRGLFRQFILSAWNIAVKFSKLADELDPAAVVIFNGMFFPEAVVKTIARRRGIRAVSHEVALRPLTAFYTTGEATAYPIEIPDDFSLSPVQEERLDHYLEKRFQGKFSMAGVDFWPEMRGLPEEFDRVAANFRKIVPVFTNVVFDTSQGHANVVFSHMFSWLDCVLAIIQAHPETLFVLRAHPDESRPGKESRESVANWVEQNAVRSLPNVIFIGSDEYVSSYALIERSKFVMVYNSTIGLEASLMGAAVLCGGRARFTQVPTVFFPATAEEFRQTAEEFLGSESIFIPPEFKRNARRFLYFQLFKTAVPFDDFLEDNGIWQGYVRFKPFAWQDLLPQNSPAMRVVVEGILQGRSFILGD